jgi:hypothetical protein
MAATTSLTSSVACRATICEWRLTAPSSFRPLLDNLSLTNRRAFRQEPQLFDRSRGLGEFNERDLGRGFPACGSAGIGGADPALICADFEYGWVHRDSVSDGTEYIPLMNTIITLLLIIDTAEHTRHAAHKGSPIAVRGTSSCLKAKIRYCKKPMT